MWERLFLEEASVIRKVGDGFCFSRSWDFDCAYSYNQARTWHMSGFKLWWQSWSHTWSKSRGFTR
jgi:hypothetical protein